MNQMTSVRRHVPASASASRRGRWPCINQTATAAGPAEPDLQQNGEMVSLSVIVFLSPSFHSALVMWSELPQEQLDRFELARFWVRGMEEMDISALFILMLKH